MALVHGTDLNDNQRALLLNLDGSILVSQQLKVIGSNTDKLLSIENAILVTGGSASLSTGTNTFSLVTVPTGYFYHIGTVCIGYTGTVTNVQLLIIAVRGAGEYILFAVDSITSGRFYSFNLDLFLLGNDILKFRVLNATATNSALASAGISSQHTS